MKLTTLFLVVGATARTCYFPDGSTAAENVPCSDETYSACCGKNDICMSNNLCMDVAEQPYVLSRGGCTDANWESSNCPPVCQDVNTSGGCSIINLLYVKGVATYCCGTPISNGSEVICPNSESSFELTSGDMVYGYAALADLTNTSATSTTAASSGSSATATACVATSTSNSSTTLPSESEKSRSSSSAAHDAAIGAGVGVPLGVIACAAVLWAILGPDNAMFGHQYYAQVPEGKLVQPAELGLNGVTHELHP
ncbi:hypothetical protein BO71DRAFT_399142 [Aspergillus ellipticus CBS 707.79]|uniref:Mid2 domain-containing protein n=1 Tax=Aspergillus ellipticus CBS 707.79 TaxID=1448320 RepID=A0A319D9T1_9EURO|nr:hypothetical protein BO71DRAFT_399142 [Aspergillus ellipticus CBS 707.79]